MQSYKSNKFYNPYSCTFIHQKNRFLIYDFSDFSVLSSHSPQPPQKKNEDLPSIPPPLPRHTHRLEARQVAGHQQRLRRAGGLGHGLELLEGFGGALGVAIEHEHLQLRSRSSDREIDVSGGRSMEVGALEEKEDLFV